MRSTAASPTPRDTRRPRAASAWLVAAAMLVSLPAAAQTAAPAASPATPAAADADRRAALRSELDGVLHDIALGKERQAAILAEIETLARDRGRLSQELVRLADRLREAEGRVAVTEKRIGDLERDLGRARKAFEARRGVLADVLATLQRMSRKPPPAIVVRPSDALAAVRSAILAGAVLPELRDQADALLADLQAIETLEKSAAAERDRFRAEGEDLVAERRRVELLVDERRKAEAERETGLDAERRRITELAARAGSLKDLVATLDAAQAKPSTGDRAAGADLGEARGRLPLPIAGETVLRFGQTDAAGMAARGISIAARAGTAVTSPCDGTVLFAGPFRSYGKLLIINGGGGYHVVLAGMERIDVEIGQTVLAGEPVGLMGARQATATGTGSATEKPILYVEFRKDGTSIDPSPWWARARDEKVRG
jgi:septal ring factor EnvC (AmiA/AmiB activator)